MQTKIYALTEVDGEIRYIGKTIKTLNRRLSAHLAESRYGYGKADKNFWICSVLSKGLMPKIQLIGEVEGNGDKEEMAWIAYGCAEGWRLTNGAEGGRGGKTSEYSKEKNRIAHLGKKDSDATKLKKSLSHLGKNKGPKPYVGILRNKKIIQLDKNGNFVQKFNSITEAATITKTSRPHIGNVCCGKRKTSGGFKWVFDKNNSLLTTSHH